MKKKRKNEISYYDHLEIFRWKIISIIIFFLIAFFISFIFIDKIVPFLIKPIKLINVQLNYFKPYEKFMTYIKIAIASGLFFSIPFMLFQIGSFVFPALKKNEKNIFFVFIFLAPLIFLLGCLFAYYVIIPVALNFFFNFASGDKIKPVWGISSYFYFFIVLTLATGLLFILPLILLLFIKIGIIDVSTLKKFRPYIIVSIFIIAAIVTPPDVLSQLLIAIPLLLFFEITVLIGKIIK
jgi:sec-independent protein translocase protein TatC